jgi:hypothetical protein
MSIARLNARDFVLFGAHPAGGARTIAASRTYRRLLIPKRDNRAMRKIRLHQSLSHRQVRDGFDLEE